MSFAEFMMIRWKGYYMGVWRLCSVGLFHGSGCVHDDGY